MDSQAAPAIMVVICSYDRPAQLTRAVESVLANDYPRFELAVVDQSPKGEIAAALNPYLEDPRFHHLRAPPGLNGARNAAIRQAESELIALTDDDCEVGTDWLKRLAAAFAEDSQIGVVFGSTMPAPHDGAAGLSRLRQLADRGWLMGCASLAASEGWVRASPCDAASGTSSGGSTRCLGRAGDFSPVTREIWRFGRCEPDTPSTRRPRWRSSTTAFGPRWTPASSPTPTGTAPGPCSQSTSSVVRSRWFPC